MASLVQKSSVRYMLHGTLPIWPINPFKPVQQSRQQVLRAYCPNIYTVGQGQPSYIPTFDFDYNFGFFVPGRNTQQKQKKWSDTGEHCLEKQLCEKNPLKLHLLFFNWEFLTGKSQFECKKSLQKTQTFLGCLSIVLGCEQKVRISATKINKSFLSAMSLLNAMSLRRTSKD